MSRQGGRPRPTRGSAIAAQIGAAELAASRARYDGMQFGDPDFAGAFGDAELAAATVDLSMRRMGRPEGTSRRAAVTRFIARPALGEVDRADLALSEVVQPPRQLVGATAIMGARLEDVAASESIV